MYLCYEPVISPKQNPKQIHHVTNCLVGDTTELIHIRKIILWMVSIRNIHVWDRFSCFLKIW